MKKLLEKYRLVIRFILTFLLVYAILSFAYSLYLNYADGSHFYPDYMTNLVAKQTNVILNAVGYQAEILPHPNEPSMKLMVNDKYILRVIEGCNAVSVIILFLAFITAFAGRLKPTLLFAFAGSIIIYTFNLVRIVMLALGLYHYPWRGEILHNVIFPLFIYGTVFLLWMIWVNRFAKMNPKHG